MTQAQFDALSQAQQDAYDEAYQALISDREVIYLYNLVLNLTILITTFSILIAVLLMEFAVPLLLGDGRTLGKKIFGLCVMHTDGIRMNRMQLFVRTVLGKFTVETMVPVYLLLMLFWGIIDLTGTIVLFGLLIVQCVVMVVTKTNSMIHDLLAGTVVADFASQRIFRSREELIEYQKALAAERAMRQDY
jgi:uncharacterized RDD family membrane protein YckC